MRQVVQDLHHQNEAGLLAGRAPCRCLTSICNGSSKQCRMLFPNSLPLQCCQLGADLYACVAQPIIEGLVLIMEIVLQADTTFEEVPCHLQNGLAQRCCILMPFPASQPWLQLHHCQPWAGIHAHGANLYAHNLGHISMLCPACEWCPARMSWAAPPWPSVSAPQ